MIVILVHVQVKKEFLDAFKEATLENARESLKEPGIARFDVLQQEDDPTKFILVEVYRYHEGTITHKASAHYFKWRETVEKMMAQPRFSVRCYSLFPDDGCWETLPSED
ncbi:MAG: antibiotic biosynthesis monooxygenase [Candidatus Omnitrophica bacterium]|nr:antibiotic biosynthesis monooxygenase [Candidatus Omnitrophota bacterium]